MFNSIEEKNNDKFASTNGNNISNRKDDHIREASAQFNSQVNFFEDCKPVHRTLNNVNANTIDLSTDVFDLHLDFPIFINAMTGGSDLALEVNRKLAILARECGLAMASGSLSSAIKKPETIKSYTVIREENPNGIILANVGAEQSLENTNKIIDIISADALQIHLNAPQELVMPEGDRDFSNYSENLKHLIDNINIPVIVKEVGFGMSRDTISKLIKLGSKNIDISGSGGTNFIKIENSRRTSQEFSYLDDFGIDTLASLLEAQQYIDQVNIIASGGIKSPYDAFKCFALGAKAVGASAFFLNQVNTYPIEVAIENVNLFKEELKIIFAIYSCANLKDAQNVSLVISGRAREWAEARGIEYKNLARRDMSLLQFF
ncbi:type 2 isopentenyl-diphosphate Delta-isomerase [Fastidiosipila sanguinis]|uniref:Isopentenyl-diphosphate delta-isomerase n=1 Tax=Fastidiosipila sanguinis TaxID=236753 RepID=A0A2S0KM49_9FIRM|nr:type 2 isopentenyl-diphosphate Delta-isomerase [Fastidiosipila sanguinis]AVM42105.1 type 2 isopentenyl-diphosphate Delta-isomerase [Fastidiosipila sanguinis]